MLILAVNVFVVQIWLLKGVFRVLRSLKLALRAFSGLRSSRALRRCGAEQYPRAVLPELAARERSRRALAVLSVVFLLLKLQTEGYLGTEAF